jgi:hypothetical protein
MKDEYGMILVPDDDTEEEVDEDYIEQAAVMHELFRYRPPADI